MTATVDPSATGTITNTATVALPGGFTDPTPKNNKASDTDTLVVDAKVLIDKAGPPSATTGDQVTYTMVVTNPGPSTATKVVVSDPVPDGLTWLTATGTGWTCSGSTVVTCSLAGPLAVGASSTLSLVFEVTATNDSIVNTAAVSTSACSCDEDSATTTVEAVPVPPGQGAATAEDEAVPGAPGGLSGTGANVGLALLAGTLLIGVGTIVTTAIHRRRS